MEDFIVSEDKSDLTLISDLEEFTHEDDPSVDSIFTDESDADTNLEAENSEFADEAGDSTFTDEAGDSTFADEAGDTTFPDEAGDTTFPDEADNSNFADEAGDSTFADEAENSNFTDEADSDDKKYAPLEKNLIKDNEHSLNHEMNEVRQKKWENFSDIRKFINNYNSSSIELGGDPPFSILIEYTGSSHEAKTLVEFLIAKKAVMAKERDLLIQNGQTLIPQISEYSAVCLVHQLKRFDAKVHMGPSGEIYQSSITKDNSVGKISRREKPRRNLYKGNIDKKNNIIVLRQVDNNKIDVISYIGFVHSLKVITGSTELPEFSTIADKTESALIDELKDKAKKLNANAVINYDKTIKKISDDKFIIEALGNAVVLDIDSENDELEHNGPEINE